MSPKAATLAISVITIIGYVFAATDAYQMDAARKLQNSEIIRTITAQPRPGVMPHSNPPGNDVEARSVDQSRWSTKRMLESNARRTNS